jgi:hypothetical protein
MRRAETSSTAVDPCPTSNPDQIGCGARRVVLPSLSDLLSSLPSGQIDEASSTDQARTTTHRAACRNWREKQNAYLNQLEDQNELLRAEALRLSFQAQGMNVENSLLAQQLAMFQHIMKTAMVSAPPVFVVGLESLKPTSERGLG